MTKKELSLLTKDQIKLDKNLSGVRSMRKPPGLVIVVDPSKEHIAVAEANKLGIPVMAVLDSNSDPDGIAFPIPGNDDAARAIALYCDLAARAVIDGLGESQAAAGVDLGAASEIEDTAAAEPATA